jgi:NAD(P)-dependent dehydrogenase (short-subunit alcohol dehydrogenase family)
MQVAIVTGASGGIGFGCAAKLAEAGMAVLATGRNVEKLTELVEALRKTGVDSDRVLTHAADLRDDDAPRRIVELAVAQWGQVDFLINVAGIGSPKPVDETDDELLDHFLDLMLRAPFRLIRETLPHMPAGSAIINVTSTFAVVGAAALTRQPKAASPH